MSGSVRNALVWTVAIVSVACAGAPRPGEGETVDVAVLPTLTPGFVLEPESGFLIHEPTGCRFPPDFAELRRGATHAYDDAGENVSVGYEAGDHIQLTLYVYPRWFGNAPSLASHFRLVLNDVLAVHPSALVEQVTPMKLPLGPTTADGFGAFVRWRNDDGEKGSFALLVAEQARFVKIRTTFSLDADARRERAWRLSRDLLAALPEPPWR